MRNVCILILLLPWSVGLVSAQEPPTDLAARLAAALEAIAAGEPGATVPEEELRSRPREALDLLAKYQASRSDRVRHYAYSLVARIGLASSDPAIRQEATTRLVAVADDPDPLVSQHASADLLAFEPPDFSPAARQAIAGLLQGAEPRPAFVRLAGVAGMREMLPRLEELLSERSSARGGKWYGTTSWAARLARARLGVEEDVRYVVERVASEPDAVVRVTVLLRDLGFIRQPLAFQAITRHLLSRETLPPSKVTAPGTAYAQYATDVLAENVPGFPVRKRYVGAYTPAEIQQGRAWSKERWGA